MKILWSGNSFGIIQFTTSTLNNFLKTNISFHLSNQCCSVKCIIAYIRNYFPHTSWMFLVFKMEANSWQQMGKVPYGSHLFFISVAIRILLHNKTMMSLTVFWNHSWYFKKIYSWFSITRKHNSSINCWSKLVKF